MTSVLSWLRLELAVTIEIPEASNRSPLRNVVMSASFPDKLTFLFAIRISEAEEQGAQNKQELFGR